MNAMTKSSAGGCGCGCGGGSKSAGCNCSTSTDTAMCACGDVGCATCRSQDFVRPSFFAGQLLTEEDLQKLIDYVVAKNRLHNQRLWGDGVVCGLEVVCDPCGGGTVTVNPGYALDCCGNDLVLSCPQSLDINAMVRDLKRNLRGGHDCGDPCPPKKETPQTATGKTVSSTPSLPSAGTPERTGLTTGETTDQVPSDSRHYCLYIRYCENATDPVSPYATDEGCNYQSCQPTRIREGVKFELRCHETCEHHFDIRDRICACIGDLDSAYQLTNYSNNFYVLGRLLRSESNINRVDPAVATQNFVGSATPLQDVEIALNQRRTEAATLATAEAMRIKSVIATPPPPAPAAPAAPAAPGTPQPPSTAEPVSTISLEEFDNWIEPVRTATAHLAAYQLAQATKTRTTKDTKEVTEAVEQLRAIATKLNEQVASLPAPETIRGYYAATLNHTIDLTANRSKLDPQRLEAIASGRIMELSDYQSSFTSMAAMKEQLLDRLERSPRIGDCQLLAKVEAISIATAKEDAAKVARTLHEAWGQYLKDCICAAFNPPCVPCEDSAVLLACIEVRDCKVIEVCNLKRKFVLSATALRYWIPPLNDLGEYLEKICCPDPICPDDEIPTTKTAQGLRPVNPADVQTIYGAYKRPAISFIDFRVLSSLCRKYEKGKYVVQTESGRPQVISGRRTPTATDVLPFMVPGLLAPRLARETFRIEQAVTGVPSGTPLGKIHPAVTEAVANTLTAVVMSDEMREFAREKVNEVAASVASKDLKEALKVKKENVELTRIVGDLSKRVEELAATVEELRGGIK